MNPSTSAPAIDPHAIPCGLVSIADDGCILAANATLARLLHLPLDALQGRAFEDLLTPSARVYHYMVLQPALRLDGYVEEVSLILRTAEDTDVHVLFNATRRQSPTGAITDAVLMHVRQRKELQDRLLHAERTAEQMPGVLFRLIGEPGGRFRMPYVSKGLTQLTGLDPATLFDDAAPLFDVVHPSDREGLMAALSLSRATLRTPPITVRLLATGRRLRWVRVHTRIHVEADDVAVWQGAVYDVTQQQQIDERLRDLDKLQAIATLAAGVAHDFNNLLGSITGLAELCQLQAEPGSRQMRNLERIMTAGQRATTLVRQLLDFSRQNPQAIQAVTLADLLRRTEALLAASLPPDVTLAVRVDQDCTVLVDAAQIEQCLLNLVNNAAHALREHGGRVQVLADLAEPLGLDGKRTAPMARLRVIDAGEGIAPELLKKIFEPFFTTKPVGQGTGLGLSAVHGVLSAHGGWVTVDSTVGHGSVFSLWLPCATAVPTCPPAPPTTFTSTSSPAQPDLCESKP